MTKVLDVVLIRKTAPGNPRDGGALTVKVAFRDERNTLAATCGDVVLAATQRRPLPHISRFHPARFRGLNTQVFAILQVNWGVRFAETHVSHPHSLGNNARFLPLSKNGCENTNLRSPCPVELSITDIRA